MKITKYKGHLAVKCDPLNQISQSNMHFTFLLGLVQVWI